MIVSDLFLNCSLIRPQVLTISSQLFVLSNQNFFRLLPCLLPDLKYTLLQVLGGIITVMIRNLVKIFMWGSIISIPVALFTDTASGDFPYTPIQGVFASIFWGAINFFMWTRK